MELSDLWLRSPTYHNCTRDWLLRSPDGVLDSDARKDGTFCVGMRSAYHSRSMYSNNRHPILLRDLAKGDQGEIIYYTHCPVPSCTFNLLSTTYFRSSLWEVDQIWSNSIPSEENMVDLQRIGSGRKDIHVFQEKWQRARDMSALDGCQVLTEYGVEKIV